MSAPVRLPVLCPQQYGDGGMAVTPCTRCRTGWNRETQRCDVETGAEHLPRLRPEWVPECPMAAQCQHALQTEGPCAIRQRGLVCESALRWSGVQDPEDHPLAFNADCVAPPEQVEEYLERYASERAKLLDNPE